MKRTLYLLLTVLALAAGSPVARAQCSMCAATVESNTKTSKATIGAGLNGGILYLLSVPYILFGVIGYNWYRAARKRQAEEAQREAQRRRLAQRQQQA